MLKYPRLKRTSVAYMPEGAEEVVLLSEGKRQMNADPIFRKLLPLLDGQHSMQEITRALSGAHTLKDILGSIHLLQKWGHLVDGAVAADSPVPYWEALGLPEHPGKPSAVSVRSLGVSDCQPLIDALQHLDIAADESNSALDLIVVDDYLRPELDAFNRQARRPWLLVRPVGLHIWLGPLVVPGKTACWECLAHRLRLNLKTEQFIARQSGQATLKQPVALPVTVALAANLTALEIARWFRDSGKQRLVNTLYTWDVPEMSLEAHPITRRPQCPVCGTPEAAEPQPIRLQSGGLGSKDGGFRSIKPEETLERYRHHLDPLTGLVNGLLPIGNADGIHIYRAHGHRISTYETWKHVMADHRFVAGGKGRTDAQAKTSAFCEALERYSAQRLGNESSITSTYAALGDQAVPLHDLVHFSEQQFADREAYNERAYVGRVPQPFDETKTVEWVKVWSLIHHVWRYVPKGICYMAMDERDQQPYYAGDSNGNAAGSSLEDAILQGFFELVERDCAAIWWYNRIPRPEVSLKGIDDEYIDTMKAYYETIGRRFWLLDLTNDLDIPTFVAISTSIDGSRVGTGYGFGTHIDPRIAAMRALTELNQLLPHVIREAEREDRRVLDDLTTAMTLSGVQPAEEACLCPDPNVPPRRMEDFSAAAQTIGEALEVCLGRVRDLGMDMLVHDLTRPDVGLPVVKVMVPGLRHFWRRLGPGRLYDVPVKLGWLAAPLREDELNPRDITL